MKIYCIGNSHVNIFRGLDSVWGKDSISIFKTHYLGPTIAYNFYEHHYNQVLEYLNTSNIDKKNDFIMLIVGEVDCRWHLPKQAEIQNKNINELVEECINRFFRCYLDIINKGYQVIVWAGHPSTAEGHNDNLGCPVYGSCEYRNKISLYWNDYLKKLSNNNNIPFLSIINYLIDDNNLTKMKYFLDYCHLKSSCVIPFVYKELNKVLELKNIDFTFGVITDGNNDNYLNIIIDSIEKNNIPNYEIIIVGNSNIENRNNVKIYNFDESIKNSWITRKKNIIIENAIYENLVILHDYICFDNNWYNGFKLFGENYDWGVNKILNNNNERFRDYTIFPPNIIHLNNDFNYRCLLPYTFKNNLNINKYLYISGSYFFIKKSLAINNKLNENLLWGQGEDVEYCNRLHNNGYIVKCNDLSLVKFLKLKHQCDWEKEIDEQQIQFLNNLSKQ